MPADLRLSIDRLLAVIPGRDVDAIVELAHPEIEWIPHRAPIEGAYRGRDEFRRYWEDTFATFEEFEIEVDEIRLLDENRVFTAGWLRTRGRGSGAETRVPGAGVIEFRDGLMCRWEDFGERDRALAAAGLAE